MTDDDDFHEDAGPPKLIKGTFVQADDRPPPPADLIFYTVLQVAHLTELSDDTILRAVRSGDLAAYKLGNQWRICQTDLRTWVASGDMAARR